MHAALDYIALAIATLPASAVLACIICQAWDEHRHFNGGNYRRHWHSKGRTASTQFRR